MTGWLQIQGVRVTDEGTYRCFARNKVGEVVAFASLTVFTPGEHPSPCPREVPGGMREGTFGILGTASGVVWCWRGAMSRRPCAAVSDQLNLTGSSLPKPRMVPEDYGDSEEDYY